MKLKKQIDLNTEFMHEVINYYTIQSFCGNSDKKTQRVLQSVEGNIDLLRTIDDISDGLSELLNVSRCEIMERYQMIYSSFRSLGEEDIIVRKGSLEYPLLLALTEEAPPFLFMRGNVELLRTNIVSIVGSRKASQAGLKKAYKLSTLLGQSGVTVASGLAHGIDTAALKGAIDNKFDCIAVIGTPINQYYPKENKHLQDYISEHGLLISQFPPCAPIQRWNFPLRNAVMSGISLATAIIEASETSGALKQADYALKQKRLVLIPKSVVEDEHLFWVKKYLRKDGVNQFSTVKELLSLLESHDVLKESGNKCRQLDMFSILNDIMG